MKIVLPYNRWDYEYRDSLRKRFEKLIEELDEQGVKDGYVIIELIKD